MKHIAFSSAALVSLLLALPLALSAADVKHESTIKAKSKQEFLTKYEKSRQDVQSFESLRRNWVRKADTGVHCTTDFQLEPVKTFPRGERAQIKPTKGQLIAYQATGLRTHRGAPGKWVVDSKSTRLIAIDIKTKEILAWREMPQNLAGAIHTTAVSPDGKYTYIAGPNYDSLVSEEAEEKEDTDKLEKERDAGFAVANKKMLASLVGVGNASATLLKVNNETLLPEKVFNLQGRLHHAHVMRNSDLMLFDTFNNTGHGHSVFVVDPKTDEVVCAINEQKLGGNTYTAFSGPNGRYVYIQMEPKFDEYASDKSDNWDLTAYVVTSWYRTSDLQNLPTFWIARLDLETGEIDREYPYPGYRSDYVKPDNKNEFIYLTIGGSDKVVKISVETGEVVWQQSVGVGPYGATLNHDESELWVLNKGETAGMWGRTVTTINTQTGKVVAAIPSSLQNDHIILTPDGKEMWVTSNGEGAILVYDANNHQQTARIDLPGRGDAHGLGMVHFPEGTFDGAKLVADQDEFHGGIDPRAGKPLNF